MILQATALQLGYGRHVVVRPTSLTLEPGRITCLIGPNGCGKSTLLRGLAGMLAPQAGQVSLDGRALSAWPAAALARAMATLPQSPSAPDGLSLQQLVRYGRYPHHGLLGGWSRDDQTALDWALEATGLRRLRERDIRTLSGGERQRAWIAMALAQQSAWLLLDEPTTFLDIGHQIEILSLLRALNRAYGLTIVMVLHDLNQASQFADRLLAMQAGRLVADGAPDAMVSPELVRQLFGIEVEIVRRQDGDEIYPYCLPAHSAARVPAGA